MRTTPEPSDPFKVPPKPAAPAPAADKLVPTGTPGIVRNERTGQLETQLPLPPAKPWGTP